MSVYIKTLMLVGMFYFVGCVEKTQNSLPQPGNSIESIKLQLSVSAEKGEEGIFEIVDILNQHIKTPHSVISWSAINESVRQLDNLIDNGIYNNQTLPALLSAIKSQISMEDTLITAQAIKKLTKVDVGYTKEFVDNYKIEDESLWLEKITIWENLLDN